MSEVYEYALLVEPDFSLAYGSPFPWGNGVIFVTNWGVLS